ncbi:hypothetical protein TRFO_18619 [Tritrichomonas foetus]|uniref:Ubiquitin-like domain-containing protein n=1 Tax=Tritrichomonas foetus TaxID=1144522 RepID=A0A1J4KKJ2_9EUKA|nr:hypothetical protein TRFO_18619 [Tritrichomonas foetus]|eukprot:OHT11825.1 hypothetical protein TRFO_18619 [Tritrichomonas foetus]
MCKKKIREKDKFKVKQTNENAELKVRVQWSRGAVLPVLTKPSATGAELSKLLKFACSPQDEVILVHNGVPINPDMSLESQFIKENDILEAVITHRLNNNSIGLDSKIQSIVHEAARIVDRRLTVEENENMRIGMSIDDSMKTMISSDDDLNDYLDLFSDDTINDTNYNTGDNSAPEINSEPLPKFWNSNNVQIGNVLDKSITAKINSIEDVGKFLEKHGWFSWMW